MRRILIGILIGALLCLGVYLAGGYAEPAPMPELSDEARHVLRVERVVDAERVEELTFRLAHADGVNEDLRAEIARKTRMVARLRAELRSSPVPVRPGPSPPPDPIVIPCFDRGEVECPPPTPPETVEVAGGCEMQLIEVENRRAAAADWWATVRDPVLGWEATRGPERAEDLLYLETPGEPTFRPWTAWAAGAGLWVPKEGLFDSQALVSVRRSRYFKPRYGWWVQLETSVNPGIVTSGTLAYDAPDLDLGGVGVQIGLERRFGK